MMDWGLLWFDIFGTTTWGGIDIGFYVSMGLSLLVALAMVIGFWCVRPLSKMKDRSHKKAHK